MLDAHQLNVFLAAAESLSFTQAAQRLHMTQPSVSQHIQSLETFFEMPLFFRVGRTLELTEAGLTLLPLAREAVALSTRIEETMISLKGNLYGHLVVGCSTSPGKYTFPQVLAEFHSRYPHVRVTCQVSSQQEAVKKVLEGQTHFALFSMNAGGHADLECLRFLYDPIVLIAPLNHPWAQRSEIDMDDLFEADFIMPASTSGTYNAVRESLARHNIFINDLKVLITLANAEAVALSVQEGMGVAFISKMVVDRLCMNKVAILRVGGLNICRNIFFARSSRRPAAAAQAAFWDFLVSKTLQTAGTGSAGPE